MDHPESKNQDSPANLISDTPSIAPTRPPPEQGAVAVTQLDELLAENAALREQLDDLKADLREVLAENEKMGRVFEANDQVKAALAENAERNVA